MRQRDKQTQQEFNDFWHAVLDVAENVVAELNDADPDDDRDELLSRLISERCDQHDCVIRDDLNIQTLLYSQNPCAGFFDGTFAASQYGRGDSFPFSALAADAFEADVTDKVKQLLDEA